MTFALEAEAQQLKNAGKYERSEGRQGSRGISFYHNISDENAVILEKSIN